ncbi:fluoride efflux transporter CrcB [Aminipila butyrica]|uniref:Fluoride-specific ion channel FluC n=1 Tax=Aminipila butyrica TaxID=433296 RepID=A0A858BVU6_9FIRM|nr:fluoride efflux transporter CrcB [Aminipila butyrica]QIB70063.1 fluoride efflux transporter CrcB [Aminipila butyrica]
MSNFLLVMAGGAIGSLCRFGLSSLMKRDTSSSFPLATLWINLVGSFGMGLLVGIHANHFSQLLIGTGLIGGFTTFSTFEMENITLFQQRAYRKLILYVLSSGVGGVGLAMVGLQIGNLLIYLSASNSGL